MKRIPRKFPIWCHELGTRCYRNTCGHHLSFVVRVVDGSLAASAVLHWDLRDIDFLLHGFKVVFPQNDHLLARPASGTEEKRRAKKVALVLDGSNERSSTILWLSVE